MSGNRHALPEQSLVRGPSAPEGLPAASALMFELEGATLSLLFCGCR